MTHLLHRIWKRLSPWACGVETHLWFPDCVCVCVSACAPAGFHSCHLQLWAFDFTQTEHMSQRWCLFRSRLYKCTCCYGFVVECFSRFPHYWKIDRRNRGHAVFTTCVQRQASRLMVTIDSEKGIMWWAKNERTKAHFANKHTPKWRPPVVGLSVFTVITLEGLVLVLEATAPAFLSPFLTLSQVSLSLSLPCLILLFVCSRCLSSRCFRGGGLVWRTWLGVLVARWWIGDLADGLDDKNTAMGMKLCEVIAGCNSNCVRECNWSGINLRWFAALELEMFVCLPDYEISVQFYFFSVE